MLPVVAIVAFMMGLSLGLLGTGGAIVAVPAMVYLQGIPPTRASGYSLFVVCVATAIGAYSYIRSGYIHWRSAFAFAVTTVPTVALVRHFILPYVPPYFGVISFTLERDLVLMLAFAAMLLLSGIGMLRDVQPHDGTAPHIWRLSMLGIAIGVISGFLGAGGGFLITPSLVIWARQDMRTAIGTSLLLISINSTTGVLSDLGTGVVYDWTFLLLFAGLTAAGIIIGTLVAYRIPADYLRKAFGWFVIALGIVVLIQEL